MSCWYRNVRIRHVSALAVLAAGPAFSADLQFMPVARAITEVSSNRNLDVTNKEGSANYVLEAGALIKMATPLSTTTIKPVLGYVDYPKQNDSALRSTVDFATVYTSQRSQAAMYGRFDRRDTYSSELVSPGFNDINPSLPTTPETGRISTGGTRTMITAAPSYRHAATQRLDLKLSGVLQSIDYSGSRSGARYVPYTYYNGEGGFGWNLSPQSGIALTLFAGRSANSDDDGVADAHGAALELTRQLDKSFSSTLRLTVQRNDIQTVVPVVVRDKSTNVGGEYTLKWQGQVSQVDLNIGSTYTPSGNGGTSRADQLQVEIHRKLSERTELNWASRYIRYTGLASVMNQDYDYLNAGFGLKWNLTRTWFITGGVEYWRQKFEGAGAADNVQASVSFGYQGLQR